MADKSVPEFPNGDKEAIPVYTGFLTRLFADLHYAVPQYTHVMRALKEMDCVRQLQRGGSSSPSKWALLQPPSISLWNSHKGAETKPWRTASKVETLNQQIRDLDKRVAELEKRVEALLKK
jgi:hypothetical protein